jgi:hypothetical protein
MKQRWIVTSALVLLALGLGAAKHQLVESWINLDRGPVQFRKLGVVGISADREIRNRFEDKFVARLRARKYDAVTSHSMVSDLAVVENRQSLIDTIDEKRIDGVISIRVTRLEGSKKEDEWSASWNKSLEAGTTLRAMIDESLPQTGEKASRLGVEVALWDTRTWECIWAARTSTYKLKALQKGAGDIVAIIIDELERAKLL